MTHEQWRVHQFEIAADGAMAFTFRNRVEITAGSPFLGGLFSYPKRPPIQALSKVSKHRQVCRP